MSMITRDQVDQAYGSVQSRLQTVYDAQEAKKSVLGWATGNNDTVEQVAGSIKMMINNQLPPWKQNGYDLADQGDNADPAKVKGWGLTGETFTNAANDIDGYGTDATIETVIANTAKATAQQQGAIQIGPLTLALPQAPNSALTTVAQTTQIANNALNQYNQLPQYVGGNSDSSYPVPGDQSDYVDSGTGGYDFSNVYGD